MLTCLEVVPHPAGGWTVAHPLDATRSTLRTYRGRFFSRRRAEAALDNLYR